MLVYQRVCQTKSNRESSLFYGDLLFDVSGDDRMTVQLAAIFLAAFLFPVPKSPRWCNLSFFHPSIGRMYMYVYNIIIYIYICSYIIYSSIWRNIESEREDSIITRDSCMILQGLATGIFT